MSVVAAAVAAAVVVVRALALCRADTRLGGPRARGRAVCSRAPLTHTLSLSLSHTHGYRWQH